MQICPIRRTCLTSHEKHKAKTHAFPGNPEDSYSGPTASDTQRNHTADTRNHTSDLPYLLLRASGQSENTVRAATPSLPRSVGRQGMRPSSRFHAQRARRDRQETLTSSDSNSGFQESSSGVQCSISSQEACISATCRMPWPWEQTSSVPHQSNSRRAGTPT